MVASLSGYFALCIFFRGCCEALLLNFLSGVDTVVILSGRRIKLEERDPFLLCFCVYG